MDREVRTGAIVLRETEPANRDAIGVPAHRFDGVIAKRSIGLPFEDLEQRRCGSSAICCSISMKRSPLEEPMRWLAPGFICRLDSLENVIESTLKPRVPGKGCTLLIESLRNLKRWKPNDATQPGFPRSCLRPHRAPSLDRFLDRYPDEKGWAPSDYLYAVWPSPV